MKELGHIYKKIFYQVYGKPTNYNTPGSRIKDAYWLMSSLGAMNLLAVVNYIKFFTGFRLNNYVPTSIWVCFLFILSFIFNYYYIMKDKKYKHIFASFEEKDNNKKSKQLALAYIIFTLIFVPLSGYVNIMD